MALVKVQALRAHRGTFLSLACLCAAVYTTTLPAAAASNSELNEQVFERESAGDLAGARALLEQRAKPGGDASDAQALAEFLGRHDEAGRRDAYVKWAAAEKDSSRRELALREIVLLDFMQGDQAHLGDDLARYRAAGGSDLSEPGNGFEAARYSTVMIPGPLHSFARMAALTPDVAPEELLPALARNVVTNGFEASGNEALQQTEYLRLLVRYIGQARELQAMAGGGRKIVIASCDSEQTGNLLKILGYRMRGSCGGDLVLETVNASRAFLTVDSAFPLTQLEQDLRANHPFELAYAPTSVPVLYDANYWINALGKTGSGDFLDSFLSDPTLCRLYLGLSHLDRPTAEALRKQASAAKLRLYANVLDFYGGMFETRNGAAVVPGSAKAWASLVGTSPNNAGAFFEKMIAIDDGWMASYFDALSRIDGPVAAYLTQPERMRRFYDALRGKVTSPGPARPVFRSSTELMLLTTSLRMDSNGQPHVPGNLEVWRNLFVHHPHGKYDGKLTRAASSWRNNDDLMEALFGLSRKAVENEPLKIFLSLNDIDRLRAKPMSPELAAKLVSSYRVYGPQYLLFADAPALSEATIEGYLDTCAGLRGIRDSALRADALGTFQAEVELWRILTIQGQIGTTQQDASFGKLTALFGHVRQSTEIFDAGRSGVDVLLTAANVQPGERQEQLRELLVGKLHRNENTGLASPAENFMRIFDAQLLTPLDTLFLISDRASKGTLDAKAFGPMKEQLSRLAETQATHASLTSEEKSSLALGYWSQRHVEQEAKVTLEKLMKNSDKRDVRETLTPFLRDSLVGVVYSYYAPAGAQLLLTNSSFARSHDFIGPENAPSEWALTEVAGTGWPESAGGRLMGSLITLPYALAQAEQNFLSPAREQALIWSDLVPQIIADVTINRWRNVRPEQVRWVSLHLERGRALFAAAAMDPALARRVFDSYRHYAAPAKVEWVRNELGLGDFGKAVAEIPPSMLYAISVDASLKDAMPDVASYEIAEMAARNSAALTPEAISRCFGTPKPTLTHSYQPGLLYLRTFPALMGYSSRILAETWESNNLYYAALADEAGIPFSELDVYVPEWNRSTIENIFATHLEDWPALLRSLHSVASNVKQHGNQSAAMRSTEN